MQISWSFIDVINSTCFELHYAHHQEYGSKPTNRIWCKTLVVLCSTCGEEVDPCALVGYSETTHFTISNKCTRICLFSSNITQHDQCFTSYATHFTIPNKCTRICLFSVSLTQHDQCFTSYTVCRFTSVLLMMGIMMPETCWVNNTNKTSAYLHLVGSFFSSSHLSSSSSLIPSC
jgi:hypothetical protein